MMRTMVNMVTGTRRISEREISGMTPMMFESLLPLSRKKVAYMRLFQEIGKHYDNFSEAYQADLLASGQDRNTYIRHAIHSLYSRMSGFSLEFGDLLYHRYGLSYNAWMFLKTFYTNEVDGDTTISDLCATYGVDEEIFVQLGRDMSFLGVQHEKVQREIQYGWNQQDVVTGNYLSESDSEDVEGVSNGFINPNWSMYSIDA